MTFFCDFIDTETTFKGKKIYECKYCKIKLTLENPDTKVLCFKKQRELENAVNPHLDTPIDNIKSMDEIMSIAQQSLYEKGPITEDTFNSSVESRDQSSNLCSKEQIDYRMSICQTCEYFKENSCLLCGCNIVREKNYNNKLAQKNQHCPIYKWKEIQD